MKSDSNRTQETIANLLAYIRAMQIQKGDMLPPEAELAEILHTSRTILREAVSHLKGLGILSSRRGSGCRLLEVDPISIFSKLLKLLTLSFTSDINELQSLRKILELGSIETAVSRATPNQVEEIKNASLEMEKLTERDEVKLGDYCMLEIKFHQAIMAPSDNRMLDSLNTAIELYFDNEFTGGGEELFDRGDLEKMTAEHSLIAKAFISKSPEAAYAALKQHVSSFEN